MMNRNIQSGKIIFCLINFVLIFLLVACSDNSDTVTVSREKTSEATDAEQSAGEPPITNEKAISEATNLIIAEASAKDFKYEYNDSVNGIEILEYIGDSSEVRIPEEIDGYSVISIGNNAFHNLEGLINVIIPDSVIVIGETAFAYCYDLESITLGNSVMVIGGAAFAFCMKLENLKIPESVKTIGYYAFANCTGLKSVVFPDGIINIIDDSAFYNCTELINVTYRGSTYSVVEDAEGRIDLPRIFYDAVRGVQGV